MAFKCVFGEVLLTPLFGFAVIMVGLGFRKLQTLMNRFRETGNHLRERISAGDTFLVAEVDRKTVGVVGIQWMEVR